ncbi:hypothetical protein TNCV_4821491 [Trichonephila clavipes]|nr:hypothetical protein TNCV_4821491 [Trichonephila clavipes]
MTIATLKDLIIGSEDYDEELTKNIHSTIVEDRKVREENLRIEEQKEKLRIEEREEKLRFEQLRLDEQKRKDEFVLEKLRIQTQSKLGADTSKENDTKFLVKEVSKFIHRFDLKEDISLYLKLFERQAQRLNIDQENWVSHLLGLLPTEVSYIIAREPDDKANSYEHVKDLLLKRFKLTPEKFRQLFVTHQKAPERTWIDFYHELNTYFNGWIDGLKIDTFKKLSDLIITDQLKRKTPFEFKEYYLDEWANMNSPVQLAEKLEEFDYEIEHRAGSRMKHVDAISRYPVMMICNDTLASKLKNAQEEDDNIQTLKSLLEKQESEEFFERNANKKTGKKEGFLNPISKESIPLSTYHVDFIGPLPSTNKSYQHIFTVVDAFTKFTWLYPVKTVSAESALEKLKQQQKTFGNPIRIISDRGSAFISKLFNDYCDEENIQHLQIATGVSRGNGQVERIHRTLIPVLTKLSLDDSTKWYKYVDRLQRILNSTISRSTKWTPFELLVGIKMRNKEDILIKDLLLEEMAKELLEQREFLRNDTKKNIETLQSENRKTYNRRRKKASLYKKGDLVAIQRTQFGAGLKLRPKFLGPYKVTKVNSKDRYEVEKVGQHDGPNSTTTSAYLMKHFYA